MNIFRSKIAENLSINRTGKQCRERYNNHLRPEIKKGEWSEEEDQILMSMNETYGNKWTMIAQYLPGRSGNTIQYKNISQLSTALNVFQSYR